MSHGWLLSLGLRTIRCRWGWSETWVTEGTPYAPALLAFYDKSHLDALIKHIVSIPGTRGVTALPVTAFCRCICHKQRTTGTPAEPGLQSAVFWAVCLFVSLFFTVQDLPSVLRVVTTYNHVTTKITCSHHHPHLCKTNLPINVCSGCFRNLPFPVSLS